jgi:PAS domain S-box-containing protein
MPTTERASPNAFESDKPGTAARSDVEAAVEALRRRGGVFVEAVRATRMAMALTDPNLPGNPIVFANESFVKLSGYTLDETLGQQPFFMNGPDTDPGDEAELRRALEEDRDGNLETTQYRKDGSRFVANMLLSAFKDDAGRTLYHFLSWQDVTRRDDAEKEVASLKKVQAQLRESEKRFRGFAENSADALWIVNSETMKLEYLSPAFERIWGECREAVMEDLSRWTDLVHPDDREKAAQGMPRVLAGESYTGAYRIVRPDGQVRWVRDTGFPIHDDGVARVGGIAQDITDLKAAEAATRESEERNRLIVENARDYAIIITDADDLITEWLPGAEAVFGWTRDEAVGRPAGITFTPEDQADGLPEREIEIAARDGQAPDVRWHQHKNGSRVFIEGMTSPLYSEDGSIRGFLKIGQDVSERRSAQEALEASEQRMRTLVTGIPQMVFRSHGTGERIWGSPQWIEYTGISLEESVGYGWLDGMHPDDRENTMTAWSGVEERGEYYCEHRILHAAAGEYRWHQTRAAPLRDKDGSIVEWLGTSTDVEDLRRLQQRQGLLLAELQHRVRNILAILRSVAGRTAETTESVEDYWQHLEGRISTMARTQGLLTRAIGSGVDLQNMVLDELLAQATKADRFSVIGPDVTLSGKAAEVLGLAIHELATNSVKYGALSADDGRIDIRWALLEGEERPRLSIIWSEFGVRMSDTPRRQGFGTELITERVPYELHGTGSMDFKDGGLVATIEFPLLETPSILQTDANMRGKLR